MSCLPMGIMMTSSGLALAAEIISADISTKTGRIVCRLFCLGVCYASLLSACCGKKCGHCFSKAK